MEKKTGTILGAWRTGPVLFTTCGASGMNAGYMAEGWPLVIARPTGDEAADVLRVTQELLRVIEEFIRRHPEQWHVPHKIWEGGP